MAKKGQQKACTELKRWTWIWELWQQTKGSLTFSSTLFCKHCSLFCSPNCKCKETLLQNNISLLKVNIKHPIWKNLTLPVLTPKSTYIKQVLRVLHGFQNFALVRLRLKLGWATNLYLSRPKLRPQAVTDRQSLQIISGEIWWQIIFQIFKYDGKSYFKYSSMMTNHI